METIDAESEIETDDLNSTKISNKDDGGISQFILDCFNHIHS